MCNHIRFTYESQPEGFFQSLLEKNSSWKAFLPQLKAATRDQLGNRKLLKSSLGPYPPLPYTPTPMTITSTTTITTTNNNNNSNDNNNISSNNDKYLASLVRKVDEYQSMNEEELDSLYAALLGYRLTKEKKKKTDKTLRTFSKYQPIARQSNSTLDLDLISSESTLFNNYQESNVKSNRSTLNLDLDLDLDLDIDLISESTLYHDDDTYQESNSIQPKSFLLTTTNDTTTRTTQEDYPSYFIMDTPTPTPTTTPKKFLFNKKINFKKYIFLFY